MSKRILLYGATGYSGRLIAKEAVQRGMDGRTSPGQSEVVLGGRDRLALEEMSEELGLDHIVFALNDRMRVESALAEFHVVINAAGPFARTAVQLAKSAISAGCHYVDINGEVDVYKRLDDLGPPAADRDVRLVSGAGFTATVSDVMLDWAVRALRGAGWNGDELGVVRIATSASNMFDFSRGSVPTMLRSVREQVTLVQHGACTHVPVGRLERSFNFGPPTRARALDKPKEQDQDHATTASGRRIASAANLLDTLTAFETTRRLTVKVSTIESYIDMPRSVRLSYQFGALSAVLLQTPLQNLIRFQINQLPEGPDEEERRQSRQTVLLQIESPYGEPWVDWRMETPNSYDFTARCALEVAAKVTEGVKPKDKTSSGWTTPARVLVLEPGIKQLQTQGPVQLSDTPFQDCEIEGRTVMKPGY